MTTNEMIYKTLRTKMSKEPRYRAVLADLGIEVFDSDCSTQGFWSVRYIPTGKMLVISKGYDNRVHLYGGENGYQKPKVRDLKMFDYIGFLRCDRKKEGRPYFSDDYVSEYKVLMKDIRQGKSDIRWAERDIADVSKRIADLMEQKKHYEERLADATNRLNAARERTAELKSVWMEN